MKVAILLPAHDEEAILADSVARLHAWATRAFEQDGFVLAISENGSSDRTAEVARELAGRLAGVLTLVSDRPGKGGAIRRAAAAVEADAYLFLDADLAADLDSAERVVRTVMGGTDLAVGSRRAPGAVSSRARLRRLVTAVYAFLADAALGLGLRDVQCGCKAFSRRVRDRILPQVRDERWFFDTELIARARHAGLSVAEIAVRWDDRRAPGRVSKVKLLPTTAVFLARLLVLRLELKR